MPIKMGAQDVDNILWGAQEVDRVMRGTAEIWSGTDHNQMLILDDSLLNTFSSETGLKLRFTTVDRLAYPKDVRDLAYVGRAVLYTFSATAVYQIDPTAGSILNEIPGYYERLSNVAGSSSDIYADGYNRAVDRTSVHRLNPLTMLSVESVSRQVEITRVSCVSDKMVVLWNDGESIAYSLMPITELGVVSDWRLGTRNYFVTFDRSGRTVSRIDKKTYTVVSEVALSEVIWVEDPMDGIK